MSLLVAVGNVSVWLKDVTEDLTVKIGLAKIYIKNTKAPDI